MKYRMKYRFYIPILLLSFAGLLLSCRQNTPSRIVYERTFEEMAQLAAAEGKTFAVVLTHPDCSPCGIFRNILYRDISFAVGEQTIFNIVDVTQPQNRWYWQLIASQTTPSTLIFSPEAELKAIIPGAARPGIECIKSAFGGELHCSRHYTIGDFFPESVSHDDRIKTLNSILTAKRKIERGEDAAAELQTAFNTLYYPFPIWLQVQNEKNLGNTEDAVFWARQMLTFQRSEHLVLYSDLLLASRKVINPDFDIATMPRLEIDNSDIHLGSLAHNEEAEIRIRLTNSGQEPLAIQDINIACSCLTLLSAADREIAPDAETYLHLLFTAEQQGEILRNVIITSTGLVPQKIINIRANVR
jgi:hypothetical protein